MNGRTHEMVAAASAVMVMHNAEPRPLVIGTMVAIMAGTLPDIDLVDNRKGKGLKMVMEVVKQSIITIGMAIYFGSDVYQIGAWLALCIVLVLQPHRGLSHSIWAMAVTCTLFSWMTDRSFIPWFLIGYGSHLAIDLLNTKDVSILFPKGFCLKMFKSGGIADDILGAVAAAVFAVVVLLRFASVDIVLEVVRMLNEL